MPWDDNWTRAFVTIAAAAVGAVLAGLANAYAAQRRITEVKLQYEYKLRDGYLENARKFLEEVYVPVSVALTTLFKNYEKYVASLTSDEDVTLRSARVEFHARCDDFLKTIDDLLERGADAYLTSDLDQKLNDFSNFVRNSVGTITVNKRRILESNFSMFGFQSSPLLTIERPSKSFGNSRHVPPFSMRLAGLNVAYSEKIIAAPSETDAFELRIRTEIPELKFLIKEVTLGSNPPSR